MDVQDSGSLGQKAFLTLLVELHQGDATGSLKLERAPLQKAVYFRDGQILFAASNDPQDQLASILVEEGKLSKDQMQVAQARVTAGNPLAKVLTELGYISQRELADAARLKVEKILTDLYLWSEGSYQFVGRSLPKGAIDLELSTPRLLFNSIRRVQEREWVLEQLGSLGHGPLLGTRSAGQLPHRDQTRAAGEVLRLVDGVKSIKQIGAISALDEFEVCKILAAAIQIRAIEKASAPEVADAAPPPLDPETPAASEAPAPAPDAGLPFSEDAVAETTVLKIGEGSIQPSAAEGLPQSPALDQAEKIVSPENRPAADFVFDAPLQKAVYFRDGQMRWTPVLWIALRTRPQASCLTQILTRRTPPSPVQPKRHGACPVKNSIVNFVILFSGGDRREPPESETRVWKRNEQWEPFPLACSPGNRSRLIDYSPSAVSNLLGPTEGVGYWHRVRHGRCAILGPNSWKRTACFSLWSSSFTQPR